MEIAIGFPCYLMVFLGFRLVEGKDLFSLPENSSKFTNIRPLTT